MNQKLQNIFDLVQQSEKLDAEQKNNLLKAVKDADKELEITAFKLERTEKVKKTTAILLEETIEELEQKRKAVEAQNRQLEIETSLEKVRTIAMAMRKPDDMLDVCKTISLQLESLGVKEIRNVQTAIFYEQRGTYMNYEYYAKHDKTIITETTYTNNKMHEEFALKMLKGKGEYFISHIKGKEVKDWIAYQKTTNVFIDSFLETASSLNYYWFSLGPVALGISTYYPLTDEEINLFQRFLKVFELAYQRYLDIEKAEAQAREAQIEAALERVRSRTMGMQKSDELKEVIQLVYEQFVQLQFNVDHAGFVVDYTPKGDWHFWITDKQEIPSKITHPYFDSVWANQFDDAKEKGIDFFTTNLNFEEKNKFYNELLSYVPGLPEKSKAFYLSCPGLAATTVLFDNVSVYIENFSGIPYSDEENKILMRFGKVFKQTYTRFLDLQKAEAQAKEAQIEAALEKIRSRSLAMQKSEELKDVIEAVIQKLQDLGMTMDGRVAGIYTFEENSKDHTEWVASPQLNSTIRIHVPYFKHAVIDEFNKNHEERGIINKRYSRELKDSAFRVMYQLPELRNNPESEKEWIFGTEDYSLSISFEKYSAVGIASFPAKLFSEEEISVLKRFSRVFEQSYVRFLDLEKAEAQARESEIQLALERVRAKTMAMHKSDELAEASTVIFEQLQHLGVKPQRCGFVILGNDNESLEIWGTVSDDIGLSTYKLGTLKAESHQIFKRGFSEWRAGNLGFLYTLEGESLKEYHGAISVSTKLPEIIADRIIETTKIEYHYNAFFKHGSITTIFHESPVEEVQLLLHRFAKVLEQTYTRFLDLQKAEEQARESEIQLALERVRARTMAMHYSKELTEVISMLYNQLKALDLEVDVCIINIFKDNSKGFNLWIAAAGQVYPNEILVPFLNNPMFTRVFEAREKSENLLTDRLTKEEKDEYLNHVMKHSPAGALMDKERKNNIYQEKSFTRSFAISKLTGLLIANFNDHIYTDKENEILIRFGKVFEQTYTRFLDLKKAEAQVREAKVEASLERVRSKAMAMNSSEDFVATISTFYHELSLMSHTPRRCGVGIIEKQSRLTELSTFNTTDKGESIEVIGKVKLEGHPIFNAIYDNWSKRREYHTVLRGNEIKEYYQLLRPQIFIPDYSNDQVQYGYFFYFDEGGVYTWTEKELSEDELQIYRRFTSVFSLAHRRYLDIKEAEARAIEAVRQASLDRIRAQIASMRTTEDLQQITPIIWRELKTLEVPFIRCGVFIIDEVQLNTQVYLTTPEGKSLGVLSLPFDSNEITSRIVKHWQKKQVYKEYWNKKEFISWTKSMMELGQVQNAETYQGSTEPPETLHLNFVPFAQGMLYVGDIDPLTDEKLDLVKTLAEAFSIAYARYEDFNRVESAFKELDKLSKELQVKNVELESENERKAIEMEEARELQLAMLPKKIPEHSHLDIKVFMQTATEVGGDYYDFSYHKDGSINIAIGDATGHGMKAGTLVTMMKSLFIANSSIMDIEDFFTSSNAAVKNSNLKRMMAAFAMLKIKDHTAKFINAAMPPLYHYRQKEAKIVEIKHHNLPLGAMTIGEYKSVEISLSKGDVLIMMSDGFPELRCLSDELFGYERVYSAIEKVAKKEPEEIISHLKSEATNWSDKKEPDDDVTFVVIKVK